MKDGLVAFAAGTAAPSDRMRAAYELQESIKARKKQLETDEKKLMELYRELADIHDEIFVVANMRPIRRASKKWIRENLPGVYATCLTVSNTDAGRMLAENYSREELNEYLREMSPESFEEKSSINMTEFDKAVGGKKEAKRYEGRAYEVEWIPSSKTQIVFKRPYEHPELLEGEE